MYEISDIECRGALEVLLIIIKSDLLMRPFNSRSFGNHAAQILVPILRVAKQAFRSFIIYAILCFLNVKRPFFPVFYCCINPREIVGSLRGQLESVTKDTIHSQFSILYILYYILILPILTFM